MVVYRHIRKDSNQPFYIGIGSQRQRAFCASSKQRSLEWRRIAMTKGYKVDILFNDLTKE